MKGNAASKSRVAVAAKEAAVYLASSQEMTNHPIPAGFEIQGSYSTWNNNACI
jgi:hypothetical protein